MRILELRVGKLPANGIADVARNVSATTRPRLPKLTDVAPGTHAGLDRRARELRVCDASPTATAPVSRERSREPRAAAPCREMSSQYKATQPSGVYVDTFAELAKALDSTNEKRERLVRASRDATYKSKKLIFELHRITPETRDGVVERAREDAEKVRELIAGRIASELDDELFRKFHKSFSPGMQEYIEAVLFLGYCEKDALVAREAIEESLRSACRANGVAFAMRVPAEDYLLGVADLTGELMRLAIGCAANGDLETALRVRKFLQQLFPRFEATRIGSGPVSRDWYGKVGVFRQSLEKVEKACFELKMRRAEFGGDSDAADNNHTIAADDTYGAKRPKLCAS